MHSTYPQAGQKTSALVLHRQFRPEPPARQRTAAPCGLLGALALVTLVELAIIHHLEAFADPLAFGCLFAGPAVATEAPGRHVLYFGDSLVKHAMIPGRASESDGLRWLQLRHRVVACSRNVLHVPTHTRCWRATLGRRV